MSSEYVWKQGAGIQEKKKRTGWRVFLGILLSLIVAALIAGIVLANLLLQDNVSHKYRVNPSLDALTKAVVELGMKDEFTLSPQEMTDTAAYFSSEEVVDGKIRYKDIYFDVAEDQEYMLLVVPFRYGDIELVMQMNADMEVRALSETERYFVITVGEVKIGELVIPPNFVDRQIKNMKKSENVQYRDGEIWVDTSFLSIDVMGKKKEFKVLEMSVVPEGFLLKTESLSEFLVSVIADLIRG